MMFSMKVIMDKSWKNLRRAVLINGVKMASENRGRTSSIEACNHRVLSPRMGKLADGDSSRTAFDLHAQEEVG